MCKVSFQSMPLVKKVDFQELDRFSRWLNDVRVNEAILTVDHWGFAEKAEQWTGMEVDLPEWLREVQQI